MPHSYTILHPSKKGYLVQALSDNGSPGPSCCNGQAHKMLRDAYTQTQQALIPLSTSSHKDRGELICFSHNAHTTAPILLLHGMQSVLLHHWRQKSPPWLRTPPGLMLSDSKFSTPHCRVCCFPKSIPDHVHCGGPPCLRTSPQPHHNTPELPITRPHLNPVCLALVYNWVKSGRFTHPSASG